MVHRAAAPGTRRIMAMRNPVSTPDRHARFALLALVVAALVVFIWLVTTLVSAAFGTP